MIIVSENLKALVEQKHLAPLNAVDNFSISLTLNSAIVRLDDKDKTPIVYGSKLPDCRLQKDEIKDDYILCPGQAILACSEEFIKMPKGYMGFLQTKGSLARLFLSVHCSDGQIEPGFEGRITFEICNMGNVAVKLHTGDPVAQLFIFQVSSNKESYNGKYNNSMVPTISNQGRK